MVTEEEVIAIYAQYGIRVTATDAREDIAHIASFQKRYSDGEVVQLVHGYAQQRRAQDQGDMKEAAAFERDR